MESIWIFYRSIPLVTRLYVSACLLCTLGVQLDFVSPFQLYFNYKLIFIHHQYWRLLTTYLFFGTIGFTFMFNLMFTYRYSRLLEEGSFRSNSADFFYMLLFGATLMTIMAPFVKILFLGHAFTTMLVYIWAKRNPQIHLNIFAFISFRAPHLPWILLGFSLILGNSVLTDVMGICVGHIYYYLQDVFPYLPGGFKCLKTPKLIVHLFSPREFIEAWLASRRNANQNLGDNNSNEVGNEVRTNQSTNNHTQTDQQTEATSTHNRTSMSDELRNAQPETQSNRQTMSGEANDQTLRKRVEPNKHYPTAQADNSNRLSQTTDQSNQYQHEHLD